MFLVSSSDDEICIEVHLCPLPFLKRVGNAINYIFGRRAPWGDFEEIILSHADAAMLGEELAKEAEINGVFLPNDVY
jgi:hypothetical protein